MFRQGLFMVLGVPALITIYGLATGFVVDNLGVAVSLRYEVKPTFMMFLFYSRFNLTTHYYYFICRQKQIGIFDQSHCQVSDVLYHFKDCLFVEHLVTTTAWKLSGDSSIDNWYQKVYPCRKSRICLWVVLCNYECSSTGQWPCCRRVHHSV